MVEQPTINLIDNIPPEKRWQPGQSGNPAGRPVNKASITYWYKKLLAEGNNAEAIAKKVLELAKDGKLDHTKEITDRTDGRLGADTEISIDNRSVTINVVSDTAKKLLDEIGEGVKPHKGD